MTDIHTHILPALDDGAEQLSESIEMLRAAAENGVDTLAVTPHYNPAYQWKNENTPQLQELFSRLCQNAKHHRIPISLHLGMEIRAYDGMVRDLEKQRLLPYQNTRYVLVEFDSWESESWCKKILEALRDADYLPVVAHPERYEFVWEKPWLVYDWLDMDCVMQITRGSLFGRFGAEAKHTVDEMLKRGWVSCVATDAHGISRRTVELQSARTYLAERFSSGLANRLLSENPNRILRGEALEEG